eukprot:7095681-Prymnesium_polylepis.1
MARHARSAGGEARSGGLPELWQTSHVGAPANEWADVLAGEAMASEQSGRGRRLCAPKNASALLYAETVAPSQVIVRLGQQPRRRCC